MVGTGESSVCQGEPDVSSGRAVCNLDTGLWESDYVAISSTTMENSSLSEEPVIDIDPVTGDIVIESADPEPVIEIDPMTGELSVEEPEPTAVIEVDPVSGELTIEETGEETAEEVVAEALEEALGVE